MCRQFFAIVLVSTLLLAFRNPDKPRCYRNKKTFIIGVSPSKLTDDIIRLKKKGNFKTYTSLFGLRMNTMTGTYIQRNDSIFLSYCDRQHKSVPYAEGIVGAGGITLYFIDDAKEKHFNIYRDERVR